MIDFRKDIKYFYDEWDRRTEKGLKKGDDLTIMVDVYIYFAITKKYNLNSPYEYTQFVCKNADYNDPDIIILLLQFQKELLDRMNAPFSCYKEEKERPQ